jgi:hypothetical protein
LPQTLSPRHRRVDERDAEKGRTNYVKVALYSAEFVGQPECDIVVVTDRNTEYLQASGSKVVTIYAAFRNDSINDDKVT